MRAVLPTVIAVLVAASSVASPVRGAETEPHSTRFTRQNDVVYRIVGKKELRLDIAMPTGGGPYPAIVYIHGGGWIYGNRSWYDWEIEEAARRGFVAATITYRLSKSRDDGQSINGFPAALEDVKAAIRFLRANDEAYAIDSRRIGVVGESAGGHLALMAGLTKPSDGFEGDPPDGAPSSEVQAVVNLSGATDLGSLWKTSRTVRPVLVILLSGNPETSADLYRKASPIYYARKDAPPILTIHGTDDSLIPHVQALRLNAAIRAKGGRHALFSLRGAGHRFDGNDYNQSVNATFRFLRAALKPRD